MLDLWFRRCYHIHMDNKKTSRIPDRPGLSPDRVLLDMGTKRWSRPWLSTAPVGLATIVLLDNWFRVCHNSLVKVFLRVWSRTACKGFKHPVA